MGAFAGVLVERNRFWDRRQGVWRACGRHCLRFGAFGCIFTPRYTTVNSELNLIRISSALYAIKSKSRFCLGPCRRRPLRQNFGGQFATLPLVKPLFFRLTGINTRTDLILPLIA